MGSPAEGRVSPKDVSDLLTGRRSAGLVRIQQLIERGGRLGRHPGFLHRRLRLPDLGHRIRIAEVDRALGDVPQQIVDHRDIRTDRGKTHAVIVLVPQEIDQVRRTTGAQGRRWA
ncbi:hypothetical protein AB0B63_28650 [Micromonospora sp. NPDC049081]|uniref:hypothetical protein n=1 Tax=Micromonospora sp. NPDC049081 TaxID=3155150 RepID=UPI0033E25E26